MLLSDYRSLFDNSAYADVLLHVHTEKSGGSGGDARKRPRVDQSTLGASGAGGKQASLQPGQQPGVRTYHVLHSHLSLHSDWFKTALSKPTQPHTPGSDGSPESHASRRQLTVHVQPDEVEAMDLLLRLIYSYSLPEFTADTAPLLFTCLRLAHHFGSSACTDMIVKHIKDVAIDGTMLQHMYNCPQGVADKPSFQPILDNCTRYVLHTFRNVPAVIRSERLRQEFCSLPFAAVLVWAESDELQVHKENCVLYMLNLWVQAAQGPGGQGVSKPQLEQLASQVRVLQLGPAYQHHILRNLRWFTSCSGFPWLDTLLLCMKRDASGKVTFMPSCSEASRSHWKGPEQWLAAPRKRCTLSNADKLVKWEIGGEQLQQLYDGRRCCAPTTFYYGGFHLQLLAAAETDSDGDKSLGIYWSVCASNVCAGVSWPNTAAVMVGPVEVRLAGEANDDQVHNEDLCFMFGNISCGVSDFLDHQEPTLSRLLALYLEDGKLCLEAKFSFVDKA